MKRFRRFLAQVAALALAISSTLVVVGQSALSVELAGGTARVGVHDPATGRWDLESVGTITYGDPGDQAIMGDWDCDGVDTVGLYRQVDSAAGMAGKVYLRNSNTTGIADIEYFFGNPGDIAVAGDFDGDGCDTVGLFRASTGEVFVSNHLGSGNRGIGAASSSYRVDAQGYDLASAFPVAGDFNGDGTDTVAFHLRGLGVVLGIGQPFHFGNPGDQLVVGAWDGGVDTVAVYRGSTGSFLLGEANAAGVARLTRSLRSTDRSVALSWTTAPGARSSHHPSSDANDYFVIAENSAKINTGSTVSGSVAVNTAAAGPTLVPGREFSLERTSTVEGDVAADDVTLNRDTTVSGDAFYVASVNLENGASTGGPFQTPDLLPVVTPPAFQTATPGVTDVTVPNNTSQTLAPGAYGDVTVGAGATLTLSGEYDLNSLSAGIGSSVLADGPSAVRIAGRLFVGKNSFVTTTGDAMVSPWDFVFYVGATNPDPLDPFSSPEAAWIGRDGVLGASIQAPNGTVRIDQGTDGSAQLVGLDVRVEKNLVLTLPPRANDVAVSVSEDGPPVGGALDATTPNGADLVYSVVDLPAKGSLTSNSDGTFSYDPAGAFEYLNDGESEDVTFTYIAKAAGVASNTATVTVTVLGENDGVTAKDDQYDASEDSLLVVAAPGVLGNDDDPDGDATVVPIVNGQSTLGGGVNVAANGSFTYDPAGNFESLAVGEVASDTFQYTAENDLPSSSTATVTLTVQGENDAPIANDGEAGGVGTFLITVSGTDPDLSDDLQVTGASVTLGTVGKITNFDGSGPEDKNSATIEYTAPDGEPATTLTFTIVDNNGGSDTGEVLINAGPEAPADPPGVAGVDAEDETVETDVDESVTILLSAASDAAGDLAFSIPNPPTGGSVGTVTPIDPDGAGPLPVRSAEVTYTPPSGQSGTFTFDFRAEEVANSANFDTATVTVDVSAAAAAVDPVDPTLEDLTRTLEENETITFSLDESVVQTGAEDVCNEPDAPCGRAAQTDLLDDDTTDPAGDATDSPSDDPANPDLVSVRVGVTAALDNVAFEVRYVANGFDATTTRTGIVIDIDSDPNTGFPGVDAANNDSNLIGTDYLVNIGANLGANAEIRKYVNGSFITVATVPATILADGHYVALDLALVGDDDGSFSYKVTTQSQISPTPGFTGILDYMPDLGALPGFVGGTDDLVETGSLRYTVLTLPSSGTLLDFEDAPIVAGQQLPTPIVKYVADSGPGTFTASFAAENTALLSATASLVFEVVVIGTCESNPAVCDDGRP